MQILFLTIEGSVAAADVSPRRLVQRCFPSDSSLIGIEPIFQEQLHDRLAPPSSSRLSQSELRLPRPVFDWMSAIEGVGH